MKKMAIMALAGVALVAQTAKAQDDKTTLFNPVHTAVTSLTIAPDARAGGMGDIGAATEPDVNSQFWNAAKYPFNISRAGVAINYTPWLRQLVKDIDLANVTGFMRLGEYQALSASLRYFSLGEVTTENMTIKPYEFAVDAAYSRMLSERFSAAVALRFIYSDLRYNYDNEASSAGKAFAADISCYYNNYFLMGNRECNFAFGVNISNIGSKISYGGNEDSEFIPTNLRFGVNWTIPLNEYNKISFAGDLNKLLVPTCPVQGPDEDDNEFQDRMRKDYYDISPIAGIFKSFGDAPGGFKEEMQEIQWSLGAEYSYNDRFMLRAGYHHESESKGNRKYYTVGAGFKMSVFALDCAYVISAAPSNPLDQTLRFSLAFDMDGVRDLFTRK